MLAYDRAGKGTPLMVFVHGFGCAREDWTAQLEFFSAAHDCIACDLPGFGETPPLTGEISMQAFAEEIFQVMAAADSGPAILVGHSMGCRPILELSIAHPDRVAGLVLVDPGRASTDYEVSRRQFLSVVERRGFAAHARSMFENMFFDPRFDALRDRLAARGAGAPAEVAVATYLAMLDWDANRSEAAFDLVAVPTLVLQSTTRLPGEDRRPLKPGEQSPYQELMMARIAGCETDSYPGVGHFTMIEAAGPVNERIRRFAQALA